MKDNKFEVMDLKKKAAKFISDKSIEISANNHKTFIEDNISTPKVLLFTNSKKGTPFVFKALSQHFDVSKIKNETYFFCSVEYLGVWSCKRIRGCACLEI